MSRQKAAVAATSEDQVRRRRPRGEPKRLLLESAREIFNRKGYETTSTREISEHAAVSETLIFRDFKSKAGLFREAMVQPFIDTLDAEIDRRRAGPRTGSLTREDTRAFVASLYNVFREHRAMAGMMFSADALVDGELAESEMIADVRSAIDRFVAHAAEEARDAGKALEPAAHDLAIRGHMAMVAGVATFGSLYLGKRPPSHRAIVDELTLWVWLRYNTPDL